MYDIDTLTRINAAPEPTKREVAPRPAACSCEEVVWLRENIIAARKALMDPTPGDGYAMTVESVAECDRILGILLGEAN